MSKISDAGRRAMVTPVLVAFVASPRLRRHGAKAYALLQRIDPFHESPLGFVVLSRHVDVAHVLRSTEFGSDERKADLSAVHVGMLDRIFSSKKTEDASEFLTVFHRLMLFLDPPDHTRLRALVAKAFTPRRVEAFAPRIAELVDELLAPARERQSMEVMSEFAYPLPARVICEMLGLPDDAVPLFLERAPALAIALDPAPMRSDATVRAANEAVRVLREFLLGVIAERRRTAREDLLSALVHAESDGERLSEDELVAMVLLLVIAGHETTANVIGNATRRLSASPELRETLAAADSEGVRRAVEEFLRLDGPVQMAERIASVDTTVAGRCIRRGQIVVLLVDAANRDPAMFEQPNEWRLDRDKNPHLAFGGGHHYCLGAPLARLELAAALPALARLGDVRPVSPPVVRDSFTLAGLERCEIAW